VTPDEARRLFPITATRSYLFAGGLAPAATPVRAALDAWSETWALDPARLYADHREEREGVRRAFAAATGADPGEVAIVDGTSRASNLAVQMIEAPQGSNVVVDDFTYPSALYPWRLPAKAHVEVRRVPSIAGRVRLSDLAAAVDDRTVAVSVCHVSQASGFRHDLAAISDLAHRHGALLLVDAAQSAGAIEVDVHRDGVDFLACTAMKWLLGAPGVGFLFVSRSLAERLAPPQVGWPSVVEARDDGLRYQPDASRHEVGMPSLSGLAATREGIGILLGVGLAAVERHVVRLAGEVIEGLRRRDIAVHTPAAPGLHAGVVALPVRGGGEIVEFLRDRGVDVWTDRPETLFRVDPHVYNDRSDLDRLFDGLDAFRKHRPLL
jgi:selenocysteine lyase/cysteine desulfurase